MAPANMRMAPSAISTKPGQFVLSPKPAPGRRGSRVPSAATTERDGRPLSRHEEQAANEEGRTEPDDEHARPQPTISATRALVARYVYKRPSGQELPSRIEWLLGSDQGYQLSASYR